MIKTKLQEGALDSALSTIYCTDLAGAKIYQKRYLDLIHEFEDLFGAGEVRLFSAPGRTEIGGNHTDHQLGHVLAASVNLDIIAAVRQNDLGSIRIKSEGYDIVTVELASLEPNPLEENSTTALIRGIASAFVDLGYTVKGFDACMTSDVLKGSGLSSSAAFEVIIGVIINNLYCQATESALKIAQIGQYAENVYFGKPCGLMDQTASSVGGFVTIDFKDNKNPKVEKVEFDFAHCGYAMCIVDTGGSHADLTPDYAAIPAEMREVAHFLGKEVLSQTTEAELIKNISGLREACGDRAILRALHFFQDDKLAVSEAEKLKVGDFEGFKSDLLLSGLSSVRHLQNVYSCTSPKEQGVPLALALSERILLGKGTYRVHGGGFAGTIQAFVPKDLLTIYKQEMEAIFGTGNCHVLSIRPIGGMELV